MAYTPNYLLERSAVRIHESGSENQHLGTGFFISRKYIITCEHVVESRENVNLFCYYFTEDGKRRPCKLPVDVICRNEPNDLALLRLPKFSYKLELLPILSSRDIDVRGKLYGYGYSQEFVEGEGFMLEYDGSAREKDRSFIKAKVCNVRHGQSGSPILEEGTGLICGVLTEKVSSPTGGALIIPASSIFQVFSDYDLENAVGAHRLITEHHQPQEEEHQKSQEYRRSKIIFTNRFQDCASFVLYLDELDQSNEQTSYKYYRLILHVSFGEEPMELPTGRVGLRMAGGRLDLWLSKGNFEPASDFKDKQYRKMFIESFSPKEMPEDARRLTWVFEKLDKGYMEGDYDITLGELQLSEDSSLEATFNHEWKKDLYFDNYEFIHGIVRGERLSHNKMLFALRAYSEIFIDPRLKPWLSNANLRPMNVGFQGD